MGQYDFESKCRKCKSETKVSDLINQPFTGWRGGKITKVNNFTCPICGSNDIFYPKVEVKTVETVTKPETVIETTPPCKYAKNGTTETRKMKEVKARLNKMIWSLEKGCLLRTQKEKIESLLTGHEYGSDITLSLTIAAKERTKKGFLFQINTVLDCIEKLERVEPEIIPEPESISEPLETVKTLHLKDKKTNEIIDKVLKDCAGMHKLTKEVKIAEQLLQGGLSVIDTIQKIKEVRYKEKKGQGKIVKPAKKNLMDYITYTANSFCAPESVKVFFRKTEIRMPYRYQSEIGYAFYTDKEKCTKLVKQFIRQKTSLSSKRDNKQIMCFKDSNGEIYNITGWHGMVNQHDIIEKLRIWKGFKQALPEIQVKTTILDGNYKPVETKTEIQERPTITGVFFK